MNQNMEIDVAPAEQGGLEKILPHKTQPKLVESADFIPGYGLKRVLWDKMPHMQGTKATAYALMHEIYHATAVGGPIAILATYLLS